MSLAVLMPLMLLAPAAAVAEGASEPARVRQARANATATIAELFAAAKVAYPARRMLLRAFKHEDQLEVWVGDRRGPMTLLTTYPICARSGELGPKRRQGDLQVPEGFYQVVRFNPWSNYHLSFGLDYPNASDRLLGHRPSLGGDIYIHGSCVTIGCIPIEDGPIEQLYLMALDAARAGRTVHVHIFPRRLDDAGMAALATLAGEDQALVAFWRNLRPGYLFFEEKREIPRISVDPKTGGYQVVGG